MRVAESDLRFVLRQPVRFRVVSDVAVFGIESIDAATCPNVNAMCFIFRYAPGTIAGKTIVPPVVDEARMLCRQIVDAAYSFPTTGYPKAPRVIQIQVRNPPRRQAIVCREDCEASVVEARQARAVKPNPQIARAIFAESCGQWQPVIG